MNITEVAKAVTHLIEIVQIGKDDFTYLPANRYFFDWNEEAAFEIFKLTIKGKDDILGLISFETITEEKRIHIRLLTASVENIGKDKIYDKIIGNLLTHVAKLAVRDFGEWACISLRPKTQIAQHYIDKYKMNITGMTLSLEVPEIFELIELYDHE
ncbi:hypothetical protein [Sphingobacterium kitahiroshimense]|uniref:hypothetical protein n=1 Tax=Sphingobacterium kitahiroshimense TaxID=470446 RepID=UPI00320B6575